MTKCIILPVLYLLLTAGCLCGQTTSSDTLKAILAASFELAKEQSVYRQQVNWDSLKPQVLADADAILTYGTFSARVQLLFSRIGDKHGFLNYKGNILKGNNSTTAPARASLINPFKNEKSFIRTALVEGKYGYILIPGNKLTDNKQLLAQSIQDSLCKLNPAALDGIIVDLRLLEGGSIHPPLTGLYQLYGSDYVGGFADAEGKVRQQWVLKKGKLYHGKKVLAAVKSKCTCAKNIKVAVLLSSITASAGEQTAIAFSGRSNTLLVGEKTYGLTTGNSAFWIMGHLLALSTSLAADRNGKIYDYLLPDIELVEGDNFLNPAADKKVAAAIKWFKQE